MATKPEQKVAQDEDAQASSIPTFCPNDGTVMVDGEVYGFPALVCPDCGYWKIKLS